MGIAIAVKEEYNMDIIKVEKLTHDYGHGRGVFGVDLFVKKGEVLGFLGPNDAGKSTTMRHLMGFSRSQSGSASIMGMDCFGRQSEIMKMTGYLPGEVALPEGLNGKSFIRMIQDMHGTRNDERLRELLGIFPVEMNQNVRRMSVGEKRKLAVIAAFVCDPSILLLDEPTSALDPMMQERFIEFIRSEKERGKTILLSSHIFSEVEALCDRIEIIKDGRIISTVGADDVKHGLRKLITLTFEGDKDYERFRSCCKFDIESSDRRARTISVYMEDCRTNEFIRAINGSRLAKYSEKPTSLEDYFMHFYKQDKKFGGAA